MIIKWQNQKHIWIRVASAITLTPANVHDSERAIKLVEKANSALVKSPKFDMMDSAYDSNDIKKSLVITVMPRQS